MAEVYLKNSATFTLEIDPQVVGIEYFEFPGWRLGM
jgi:hypothetical protein